MNADIPPVLDTCVLVDMLIDTRPQHANAIELERRLEKSELSVLLPWHALFELRSAMLAEMKAGRAIVSQREVDKPAFRFPTTPVPIDESFFMTYFNPDLPHIKAGDLIFLALAKGIGAQLITEDRKLFQAAETCGVQAYSIEEYLEANE